MRYAGTVVEQLQQKVWQVVTQNFFEQEHITEKRLTEQNGTSLQPSLLILPRLPFRRLFRYLFLALAIAAFAALASAASFFRLSFSSLAFSASASSSATLSASPALYDILSL